MVIIESLTKRGFPYLATFDLSTKTDASLPFCGTIMILNSTVRVFFAEILVDAQTEKKAFVFKILWSDMSPAIRNSYRLSPGQTLYLYPPDDKVAFLLTFCSAPVVQHEVVLDFFRPYSLVAA